MTDYILSVSEGMVIVEETVVKVDYEHESQRLIANACFDFIHRDIFNNDNFQISKEKDAQNVEVFLVCFNRHTSSRTVMEEFEKMKLIPAGIEELIFYVSLYPETLMSHSIVALGKAFRYERNEFVVHAGHDSSCGRFLSKSWSGHRWERDKRFMATKR